MIPYVACMLVGTGMLAQFSITLARFLAARRGGASGHVPLRGRRRVVAAPPASSRSALFPFAIVGLAAVCVLSMAWPRPMPTTEMKLDEFGRLPVVFDGRVKPIDSLARGMLKSLSGKQTFKDNSGKTQPAVRWFLDTVAKAAARPAKHKVIQIYNLDVLETLGLERRAGFRYAINEFADKIGEVDRQVQEASDLDPSELTVYQKKLLELARKLQTIRRLELSFEPPQVRPEHAKEDLTAALHQLDALSRMQLPLVVPPGPEQQDWDNFASAWFNGLKARVQGQEPNPAMMAMTQLIVAYDQGDVERFNSELAKYQTWLGTPSAGQVQRHEGRLRGLLTTRSQPLFWATWLYVLAFVLAALAWLGWSKPLNRAALGMILLALSLHTFGLVSRIYISGRPPVTNLYSSAVFIGLGAVVFGIVLELIYRLGIGNVVASVGGFLALAIAIFGLDDGSDTMGVLQAVLDTQFWLATHVVCITLGYATTFMAGMLGIVYILRGVLTPSLTPAVGKDLSRMIYGMLCFAMFFSFVGTVLGGLWADDSWGRFWGWDPKENGALMIVLWNALVLHARWGAMVSERGLAALAVVGNIVTAWSWFGVNELGVGLHSYGFTEGVLMTLGLFIASQLGIIALALLPKDRWWSTARQRNDARQTSGYTRLLPSELPVGRLAGTHGDGAGVRQGLFAARLGDDRGDRQASGEHDGFAGGRHLHFALRHQRSYQGHDRLVADRRFAGQHAALVHQHAAAGARHFAPERHALGADFETDAQLFVGDQVARPGDGSRRGLNVQVRFGGLHQRTADHARSGRDAAGSGLHAAVDQRRPFDLHAGQPAELVLKLPAHQQVKIHAGQPAVDFRRPDARAFDGRQPAGKVAGRAQLLDARPDGRDQRRGERSGAGH